MRYMVLLEDPFLFFLSPSHEKLGLDRPQTQLVINLWKYGLPMMLIWMYLWEYV
mgnify:CR=1 FL=1